MSYKSISYILGWIMKVEGVFMFLPLLVALIYREKTWVVFLGCALFCLALGIGTVICGVMLSLWKKPVTERDEEFDELSDQKLKDEEITFTLE